MWNKIIGTLDNSKDGFSARKSTALWSIMVATVLTYLLPKDAMLHALYAWQVLALLCLGIVTAEQVIKLKNGKDEQT